MKAKGIALGLAMVTQVVVFGATANESNGDSTSVIAKDQSRMITGEASKVIYTVDGQDSTTLTLEYAFYTPGGDGESLQPYQKKFNEIVYENTLWETLSNIDEERILSSYSADFFTARLDTVAAIHAYEQEHYEYHSLWDLYSYTEVYDFKQHVSLTISNYSYTGGAHGGSNILHYQIDRSSGRILELKDLFTNMEAVNKVAELHFRELFELNEDEDLLDGDFWFPNDVFSVNENFTIRGTDIVFHFNEYEIAPYYYGHTELIIPLEELTPFMTDYLKKTLN